jgi:hypothetical protein
MRHNLIDLTISAVPSARRRSLMRRGPAPSRRIKMTYKEGVKQARSPVLLRRCEALWDHTLNTAVRGRDPSMGPRREKAVKYKYKTINKCRTKKISHRYVIM